MPIGDGYQPQLNPGVQTDFSPAPGNWGDPLTQGVEQAGNEMDDAIHQVKEKQRDAQATAAGVQFAQDSANLDQQAVAARQQAGPGGYGHTQQVANIADSTAQDALSNIGDRRIRQQFAQRYADLKGQLTTRESGWEAGQYVEHLASNVDKQGTVAADQLASSGDHDMLLNQQAGLKSMTSSLSVNPDLQDKLYREQVNKLYMAYSGNVVRTNPTALIGDAATGTKGLLDDPNFTSNFSNPDAIDTIRHQAMVQVAHDNNVKNQALAQARAAQQAANETMQYEVGTLGKVLKPDEIQDFVSKNTSLGLIKSALEFSDLFDKSDINQSMKGQGPSVWDNTIQALTAKIAQEGDNASDHDRMHLKNLIAMAPKAKEEFTKNAQLFSQNTPMPAPAPIDWNNPDPAALAAQGAKVANWANVYAKQNGIVNPASIILSPTDEPRFKQGLTGQPQEQIKTIQQLQSAFGAQTTAAIVQHLAPGNKNLAFAAGLDPRGIQLMQRGQAALDAKELTLGEQEGQNVQDDKDRLKNGLNYWMDAVPIDQQSGFYEVAPKIAAGVAAENGRRTPTGDELSSVIDNSVQRIGGLQGDGAHQNYTGGFATINGSKMWLPSNMGRQEAVHRLGTAQPADWIKAGAGQPYYAGPNGKLTPLNPVQMASQQFLKYRIVPVTGQGGTGVYALQDPNGNGRLKAKNGADWTFNIRNLR